MADQGEKARRTPWASSARDLISECGKLGRGREDQSRRRRKALPIDVLCILPCPDPVPRAISWRRDAPSPNRAGLLAHCGAQHNGDSQDERVIRMDQMEEVRVVKRKSRNIVKKAVFPIAVGKLA